VKTATNSGPSIRDWLGLSLGISWGLILGHFFQSGDMTGPWLVILFGPPVVLLIAPARPLVSWQVPIIAAILSSSRMMRGPEDAPGMVLLEAFLSWLMCSVFSSPWALIFYRRAKRVEGRESVTSGAVVSHVGVGFLVFLACALMLVGVAENLYPADLSDPRNHALPFYAFLMATTGIGLSVGAYKVAGKLGISKPVQAFSKGCWVSARFSDSSPCWFLRAPHSSRPTRRKPFRQTRECFVFWLDWKH
jgi:hypothetical protein